MLFSTKTFHFLFVKPFFWWKIYLNQIRFVLNFEFSHDDTLKVHVNELWFMRNGMKSFFMLELIVKSSNMMLKEVFLWCWKFFGMQMKFQVEANKLAMHRKYYICTLICVCCGFCHVHLQILFDVNSGRDETDIERHFEACCRRN